MKILTVLLSVLFICISTLRADATPLNASSMDLADLQSIFTGINATSIDVNADERRAEIFAIQTESASATYVATISNVTSGIEFGLYDIYNINNQLTLFDTSAGSAAGNSTQVYIDFTSGAIVSYYLDLSGGSMPYHQVDSSSFSSPSFGFFIATGGGTYYSQSDLNPTGSEDLDNDGVNDNDHFLTYMGEGDFVQIPAGIDPALNDFAHWYIAAEASPLGGSDATNFADLVVQVESMQPVPEPTTILLSGLGLLSMGAYLRRRANKSS